MKKIASILGLGLGVLLIVSYGTVGLAAAHVLKQDNGISGVLHIPPEDNPAAGQSTELDESFGDAKDAFTLQDCNCGVVVRQGNRVLQTVKLTPHFSDSTLDAKFATVRFPSIGIYDVIVQGNAKNGAFNNFTLDYLVRVAVSANGSSASSSNGTQVLILGAGALAILGLFAYTYIRAGGRYKMAPAKKATSKVKGKKHDKKA